MFLNGPKDVRSRTIFINVTVTFILASILVAARLYSRVLIKKFRGWDNYCIIAAWIIAFCMTFAVDLGTSRGLGRHPADIVNSKDGVLTKAEYVAIVLFNPALMATKTSILLLYLRLSPDRKTFFAVASYVTLAVVNIGGIALTFTTAFQCQPVKAAYSPSVANPTCISIESIYLASAPVNVATDLAIFILPIPVLTALRLPRRQKLFLVVTFLLGAFVTVVDVARIYYLQLAADELDISLDDPDKIPSLAFSYNTSIALMWSVIEVNIGIICACIPTLKPLIKRFGAGAILKHVLGSSQTEAMNISSSQDDMFRQSSRLKDAHQHTSSVDFTSHPVPAEVHLGDSALPAEEQEQQPTEKTTMINIKTKWRRNQPSERSASFNVVHLGQLPRSMVDIQGREAVKFWFLTAGLLFYVGFAFGMLISISSEILAVSDTAHAIGISSAIYGGSTAGPILGQWLLRHKGFRFTFMASLGICCCGTLMFWPSGALHSYAGFVISSFVTGFGLGLVDSASNAFFMLCGPPQYAELRLLLGQSVEAVAAVLSVLLSIKVLSVSVSSTRSFIVIQWAYLVIAVLTVALGLLYYYVPLPEAEDSDVQNQLQKLGIDPSQKFFDRFPVQFTSLTIAAVSSVCAGGGLVCIRIFTGRLFRSVSARTHTTLPIARPNFSIFLTAVYAISQALFAVLTLWIAPRILLLIAYLACIVLSVLLAAYGFPQVAGVEAVALVFAIFGGSIPPLIFALAMRGMGRWTKVAASFIESAINIGVCVAPLVGFAVIKTHAVSYAFGIIVALLTAGVSYPIYLNLVPAARRLADARSYQPNSRPG